jgi:hypothetical protein
MTFRGIETLAGVVEGAVGDLFFESVKTCQSYEI